MESYPVLAHTASAQGMPSQAYLIGYAINYKDAEKLARAHYEEQLDGKPPTSWEADYSFGSVFWSFYNEYKEKYKDWKAPESPFKGEWMLSKAERVERTLAKLPPNTEIVFSNEFDVVLYGCRTPKHELEEFYGL